MDEKVNSFKRAFASIIDIFFLMIVGSIISTLITMPLVLHKTNRVLEEYSIKLEGQDVEEIVHFIDVITPQMQTFYSWIVLIQFLLFVIVSILYYTFFEGGKWQATIGKKVLGLKVVCSNGKRITKKQSFKGALNRFIGIIPLGAGLLTAFIRKDGLAFHDWISKSKVIVNGKETTNLLIDKGND